MSNYVAVKYKDGDWGVYSVTSRAYLSFYGKGSKGKRAAEQAAQELNQEA